MSVKLGFVYLYKNSDSVVVVVYQRGMVIVEVHKNSTSVNLS
jgi:hypothetical protein